MYEYKINKSDVKQIFPGKLARTFNHIKKGHLRKR